MNGVRVMLLPGERRYHQSSVQLETCNPVYNEVFGFCVSCSSIALLHDWIFLLSLLLLLCVFV